MRVHFVLILSRSKKPFAAASISSRVGLCMLAMALRYHDPLESVPMGGVVGGGGSAAYCMGGGGAAIGIRLVEEVAVLLLALRF